VRVVRFIGRVVGVGALFTAMSFVPLVQSASAKLAHKAILLEANDAVSGFDKTVPLGMTAEMVGFTWSGRTDATMDVRGLVGSTWTDWVTLDGAPDEGPDKSSKEHHFQVSAGPTWLGKGITTIEVRVTSGVANHLTAHAIQTEPAKTEGFGVKPAGADTPIPFITTRAQWGADESLRGDGPSYASKVDFAVVHHTVNSNNYGPQDSAAMVRGIYLFHVQANGWSDIGYNFLVDRYGQVFEGRYGGIDQPVIGAHAGGFNAGSTGVALIGDFSQSSVPGATYQSLRRLLAWKFAFHGIDPNGWTSHTVADSDCNCQRWAPGTTVPVPTIVAHGDLDYTECPGHFMYDLLPQLRQDVGSDIAVQGPAEWACQWDQPTDFGPGAVSRKPGEDDVFIRGGDGHLWHGYAMSPTTRGWADIGGVLTSDPDAVSSAGGRIDVVVRGTDNGAWHNVWNGVAWTGWESLGGYLGSGLTIASWGPNHFAIAGCGRDGAIWTRSWNGVSWDAWTSQGGIAHSSPDMTSDGPGRLDLVVRGRDRGMYEKSYRNGAWGGWVPVGGVMTSGGGLAANATDNLVTVTRGTDNAVWVNRWVGSGWTGWFSIGGVGVSDPDVTQTGPSTLVVTVRGTDFRYWQQRFDGTTWSGWHQI
jgi:hypothetical protein